MAKDSKQDTTDDTGGVKSYDAPEQPGLSLWGMGIGRIVTIVVVILLVVLLFNWIF